MNCWKHGTFPFRNWKWIRIAGLSCRSISTSKYRATSRIFTPFNARGFSQGGIVLLSTRFVCSRCLFLWNSLLIWSSLFVSAEFNYNCTNIIYHYVFMFYNCKPSNSSFFAQHLCNTRVRSRYGLSKLWTLTFLFAMPAIVFNEFADLRIFHDIPYSI